MSSTNKVQTFLYLLLRDHATFGQVEKIVSDVEKCDRVVFTEELQARYAKLLAMRLGCDFD